MLDLVLAKIILEHQSQQGNSTGRVHFRVLLLLSTLVALPDIPRQQTLLVLPSNFIVRRAPETGSNMARTYADVNQQMPRSYWDYDSMNIAWGVVENYEVVRKIGRGKYAEVFEGIHVVNCQKCVIKILKPVKKKKVKRQIKLVISESTRFFTQVPLYTVCVIFSIAERTENQASVLLSAL